MRSDVIGDEEKWLAEGIAGIQHHAFYMHRALVLLFLTQSHSSPKTLILRHLVRFHISIFAGRQQSQRRPQILGPDAVGAQNLSAFASQILRSL